MPRYNPREGDPQRYARAMAQQSELRKQCAGQYTVARICPFCDHKVEILYRGSHGPCSVPRLTKMPSSMRHRVTSHSQPMMQKMKNIITRFSTE